MTERDHSAVLSNFNFSPYTSEFERVKAHVLFQLQLHDQAKKPENAEYQKLLNKLANPELSEEDAKLLLVTYYNTFVVNEPNQAFTDVFGIRPRATSSAFSKNRDDGDSPSQSRSSFSSLFGFFRGESNSPQPGADNPALNTAQRQDSEELDPTINPIHDPRKKRLP